MNRMNSTMNFVYNSKPFRPSRSTASLQTNWRANTVRMQVSAGKPVGNVRHAD